MRWWSGSSEPETILPIFFWYWPHFFWDCFPEHISKVDSVQHDAVPSAPLLAISAAKLGLRIWWGSTAIIWAVNIWLKNTAVIVAASTAVDDIFLKMIQCHDSLTLAQVINIDAVCDTRMPRVEWEASGLIWNPRYEALCRVACGDVFLVCSDSLTRGRSANGQAWSFVGS